MEGTLASLSQNTAGHIRVWMHLPLIKNIRHLCDEDCKGCVSLRARLLAVSNSSFNVLREKLMNKLTIINVHNYEK